MKIMITLAAAMLALVSVCPTNANAVDGCKAKIAKDGVIQVSAKNVSGTLKWGNALGTEVNSFANAGSCVAAGGANKCELGAEGNPQRITPPELCTVFLADGGGGHCSAFLKGCTPGLRSVGSGAGFVSKTGDVMSGTLRALSIESGFPVAGCGPGDICATSRLVAEFGGADIEGDLELGNGIRQGPNNGGVVKAGLVLNCDAQFSSIGRFFNTTGSGGSFSVVGAGFGNDGDCTLTTPFPIATRFFSATGIDSAKVLVTVEILGSNTIRIRRTRESLGVFGGSDGLISLLIY